MPLLSYCAVILISIVVPHALAEVQVKGYAETGSAPGKLTIPGELITPLESELQGARPSCSNMLFGSFGTYQTCTSEEAECANAGEDATRYTASFSSFLATPDTKAAEDFTPLGWRYRSSNYDDPSDSTTQVHS